MEKSRIYLCGPYDLILMALAFFSAGGLLSSACASSQTPAQTAASASQIRETVCAYVALVAPSTPELDRVADLCRAGAQLKQIAAAYAGCAAATATIAPDASASGLVNPWPDASASD